MHPVIVSSEKDEASKNIKKSLIENFGFKETTETFEGEPVYKKGEIKLITTQKPLIEAEHLDKHPQEVGFFIFASKHKSEKRVPALLVHTPGNWINKADLGGNPEELGIAYASAVKEALIALEEEGENLEYEKTLEVTHHGPTTLKKPLLFVEIGSDKKMWENQKCSMIVASAILRAAKMKKNYRPLLGIGGGHYAREFNKIVLETDFAVGHIAPKYVLDELRTEMLQEALEKTFEKVETAVIDWKGTSKPQREKIAQFLHKKGINLEKTKEIRK